MTPDPRVCVEGHTDTPIAHTCRVTDTPKRIPESDAEAPWQLRFQGPENLTSVCSECECRMVSRELPVWTEGPEQRAPLVAAVGGCGIADVDQKQAMHFVRVDAETWLRSSLRVSCSFQTDNLNG